MWFLLSYMFWKLHLIWTFLNLIPILKKKVKADIPYPDSVKDNKSEGSPARHDYFNCVVNNFSFFPTAYH